VSARSASPCSPPSVDANPRVCCSRCRRRPAGSRIGPRLRRRADDPERPLRPGAGRQELKRAERSLRAEPASNNSTSSHAPHELANERAAEPPAAHLPGGDAPTVLSSRWVHRMRIRAARVSATAPCEVLEVESACPTSSRNRSFTRRAF